MPTTPQFADAIAMLKADHRKVEELFDKFETAREGSKESLAQQICNELKIHTVIEEEIFYPALKDKIERETLTEAYVEHDGAKVLINDIMSGGDDEFYDAKVKVLQEEIEHHVKEEEQREEGIFAQARKGGVDVEGMLEPMLARKQELTAQAEAGGLPPAKLTTVETA